MTHLWFNCNRPEAFFSREYFNIDSASSLQMFFPEKKTPMYWFATTFLVQTRHWSGKSLYTFTRVQQFPQVALHSIFRIKFLSLKRCEIVKMVFNWKGAFGELKCVPCRHSIEIWNIMFIKIAFLETITLQVVHLRNPLPS